MSKMVRLRPGARPVRRAPGEVQFGLSPALGIVLAGLTDAEAKLLLSLAGDAGTCRQDTLAERFGVPPARVTELLAALAEHDLLASPSTPRLAASGAARIAVPGEGVIIDQLRAGCRAVEPDWLVTDLSTPQGGVDLVVLSAVDALAPDVGRPWQEAGVAQLPVVIREHEAALGPLIVPGRSACLRCLDLHRRDRDHAWPTILTQIATPSVELQHRIDAPAAEAATVAALVTLVLQECLRRPDAVLGTSWHLSLPLPQVCTRQWEPHPACCCTRAGSHPAISEAV